MRGTRLVGLLILVIAVIGVAAYSFWQSGALDPNRPKGGAKYEPISIRGYVGGEKLGFLADPKVQDILAKRYRIELDAIKAGSIEMVRGRSEGMDFLWPSSQVALEIYKANGGRMVKDELIFNSPIVFYSWDIVADALEAEGIVQRVGGTYYVVDTEALVALILDEGTWADIGVSQLYGQVRVISTDPTKSNSGNQFSGLLANTLNGGEVVNTDTIQPLLPTITSFYERLGFLHHSSGDLFSQYLKQGVGAYPLIVGYESQVVEFSIEHQESLDLIRQKVRLLYPQPTVWSSHPLVVVEEDASRLIDALMDPDIQQLAWTNHGFRTGLPGVKDDPTVLQVAGIPATIDQVIPMPRPEVMDMIIAALEGQPSGTF